MTWLDEIEAKLKPRYALVFGNYGYEPHAYYDTREQAEEAAGNMDDIVEVTPDEEKVKLIRALRDAEAALKRAFDVAAEAKDRTSSSIAVVNFTAIRDIAGEALDYIARGGDEQIERCRRCGKTGWHVCVDGKIAAPSAEKPK